MAPPEPPRDKELITLKQVEEYATLSPLRFKATVNLINDFVAVNEDACADSPRQWSKSNWRELSVLFVAEVSRSRFIINDTSVRRVLGRHDAD